MKCQVLLFVKNKKTITKLSSAELAKRVVKAYESNYNQICVKQTLMGKPASGC